MEKIWSFQIYFKKKLLTEEILSITAGFDRGSYAKPLLCKCYCLTCGCVSPNFCPETTFSKVAGGRVRTADLQTRRIPTLSKKNLLSHLYWGTQWTMEIS